MTMIVLPQPLPLPFPVPSPGIGIPYPSPSPIPGVVSPTITPGIGVAPSGASGSVFQPFADLFHISVDWRYILAIFLLLITISIAENYSINGAWIYVAILLLGAILVNAQFTREFTSGLSDVTRTIQGR
jgi:hypothetical protein